jgi:hypothetical protein
MRSDVKPEFVFYSAPTGDVVSFSIKYRAGNGRRGSVRGFYAELTTKNISGDRMAVSWLPFSAPCSSVLLAPATRFSLPDLQGFASLFDVDAPKLAAAWLADKASAEKQVLEIAGVCC